MSKMKVNPLPHPVLDLRQAYVSLIPKYFNDCQTTFLSAWQSAWRNDELNFPGLAKKELNSPGSAKRKGPNKRTKTSPSQVLLNVWQNDELNKETKLATPRVRKMMRQRRNPPTSPKARKWGHNEGSEGGENQRIEPRAWFVAC